MTCFHTRLREEREANKMSQDDLAKLVNVSQQTISRYERGPHEPSFELLVQICKALETSSDYLLGIKEI